MAGQEPRVIPVQTSKAMREVRVAMDTPTGSVVSLTARAFLDDDGEREVAAYLLTVLEALIKHLG